MIIDMEELEKVLAEAAGRAAPDLKGPKFENLVARIQTEVGPEMTRWRTREHNAQHDPAEILQALCLFMASTMAGELMQKTRGNTEAFAEGALLVVEEIFNMMMRMGTVSPDKLKDFTSVVVAKPGGRA